MIGCLLVWVCSILRWFGLLMFVLLLLALLLLVLFVCLFVCLWLCWDGLFGFGFSV